MMRWPRPVRGAVGTALTIAGGLGLGVASLGVLGWLSGEVDGRTLLHLTGQFAVVGFVVGLTFAAGIAFTARRRRVAQLSVRQVTSLGAGAGLLYFGAIAAANGARVWSAGAAVGNLVVLVGLGAGAATALLLIARRADGGRPTTEDRRAYARGARRTSTFASPVPMKCRWNDEDL